jgi:hypothetical protein
MALVLQPKIVKAFENYFKDISKRLKEREKETALR